MMKRNSIELLATLLVIVGALVWGIMAVMPELNLVVKGVSYLHFLSPEHANLLVRIIYGAVGLAGVYSALMLTHLRK
jgi:uncharacterized membrane protein YuzA (DUF378 family)